MGSEKGRANFFTFHKELSIIEYSENMKMTIISKITRNLIKATSAWWRKLNACSCPACVKFGVELPTKEVELPTKEVSS
jgi:hypothetical protein